MTTIFCYHANDMRFV